MARVPNLNRLTTRPLGVPRTRRTQNITTITTLPAGRMVPIAAVGLLREDGVRAGRMRLSFEMHETTELLLNAVNVRAMAYFVPTLAFERFNGSMDIMNRSYMGQPPLEGEEVIPYVTTELFGTHGENKIYEYLGLHAPADVPVNTLHVEAYNLIYNYRAKMRSKDITLREMDDTDLAPAFWAHERFRHIVADVDLRAIDGEVPLNVLAGLLPLSAESAPVKLDFILNPGNAQDDHAVMARGGDGVASNNFGEEYGVNDGAIPTSSSANLYTDLSDIMAELAQDGITVSLSNIALAKKTAAFARLRQQFAGHDDEWLIDLLMSGIQIPDQHLKQPILLADRTTVFGLQKRYASDAGHLDESAVNGATFLDLAFRLPRVTTGGVIMVVAEVTPDQLFERQADPFLFTTTVAGFPDYLRDALDPEPVETVLKREIDTDHEFGTDVFGFRPMNAKWFIDQPRVGGELYRPTVDGDFDEERLRIWANEVENPAMAEDFFVVTEIHTKPFVDPSSDPFECVALGQVLIEGNTVFGPGLIEAADDYDKVMEKAPTDRIQKPTVIEDDDDDQEE